jgi:hypothetical protein
MSGNEKVEDNLLEVNESLREEMTSLRIKLDQLETEQAVSREITFNTQKDADALRIRAAKARGKVMELPAELLLGSVHDYSAIVEQLIECLMELEVKEKDLNDARVSLEKYHVCQNFSL